MWPRRPYAGPEGLVVVARTRPILDDKDFMRRFPTHSVMSFLLLGMTTRATSRHNVELLRNQSCRVSQREMFDLGDELQRAASAIPEAAP